MALVTPPFRVNYPNVFKPRKNALNEKLEYSLLALFPKGANLDVLKKAMHEACAKRWGNDSKKWPKPLRSPIRDQADLEKELDDGTKVMPDGCEKGAFFINMKTNEPPLVVGFDGRSPIIDQSEFYAGCWARACVNPSAYDAKGNKGVSFYLQMVQKVKDDDTLSGRPKPEECFAPVSGGAEEEAADSSAASDPFNS